MPVIVARLVLRLNIHLALPRLSQVLLGHYIFLYHSGMLQLYRVVLCLDKLAVYVTLLLATCFAQLLLLVDLVGEIELEEVLLLFLFIHGCLDLDEGLLGAEMRLVIQVLHRFAGFFPLLLLNDLILQELLIRLVLLLSVQHFDVFHVVHVVEGGVELGFLVLTGLPCCFDLVVEALKSLFVHGAYLAEGVGTLVGSVVVHGEGALRAHEFR